MLDDKSYVGDIGTRVRSYLNADITNVSGLTYYWKKPIASAPTETEIVTHEPSIEDYLSGVVYYDTLNGDFDVGGEYKHQVLVVYSNGNTYRSYSKSFMIYEHFE